MSVALISGPYFIKLVHLPRFGHFESGTGFYLFESGSGFYQTSPGPDFISFESGSGSGSYQGSPVGESGSGFYQFFGPGPDFIHRVRIRPGFYLDLSPGPDFIKHVRIRVWFYQHPFFLHLLVVIHAETCKGLFSNIFMRSGIQRCID